MSVESLANDFIVLFKRHLNGNSKAQIRMVVCQSVDWENRTMTAVDENALPYYNVALGLGAVMIKPTQGSECIISILDGEDSVAWLIHADEADEIVFRDGNNGGLTNTPELAEGLKKNNEILNAILSVISGAPITEPGNGAASALQVALNTELSGKQTGDFSKIEDKNILH